MNFTKSGKGYIVQTYTVYNIEHLSKLSKASIILCSGKFHMLRNLLHQKELIQAEDFAYFVKRMGQDYSVHMQLKKTRQLLAVDIAE